MNFELGKKYIVEVTEKGIIPREEFLEEKYFNKDLDDLDFLMDEEKVVVINEVLDKIRDEIIELRSRQNVGVLECLDIIDKYKAESEEKQDEDKI